MEPGRTVTGDGVSDHIVQFFETTDTLAASVAGFLHAGLDAGDNLLVLARPSHRDAVTNALAARGASTAALVSDGRLTLMDACAAVDLIVRRGVPDASLFDETIGSLVRKLGDTSRAGVHVYGELVDLLAEEGNFGAVEALEDLWNGLAAVERFTLLCGYQAAHFGPWSAGGALRRICAKHTRVDRHGGDLLANWLLRATVGPPPPEATGAS